MKKALCGVIRYSGLQLRGVGVQWCMPHFLIQEWDVDVDQNCQQKSCCGHSRSGNVQHRFGTGRVMSTPIARGLSAEYGRGASQYTESHLQQWHEVWSTAADLIQMANWLVRLFRVALAHSVTAPKISDLVHSVRGFTSTVLMRPRLSHAHVPNLMSFFTLLFVQIYVCLGTGR
jgi:hypothetical protein